MGIFNNSSIKDELQRTETELKALQKLLEPTGKEASNYIYDFNGFNANKIPYGDLRIVATELYRKLQDVEAKNRSYSTRIGVLTKKLNLISKSSQSLNYQNITQCPICSNFIAIDFETSNNERMACQLGLILVENGDIKEEKCYLIQPPGNIYSQNCIAVHRITPEDTKDAPTFKELWPEISEYFTQNTIIAHNANFDIDVLQKNAEYYDIKVPLAESTICTMSLHNGAGLVDTCKYYDITLENHHNALSDAKACALIYLAYLKSDKNIGNISIEPKSKFSLSDPNKKIKKDTLKKNLDSVIKKDTIFFDRRVVISGVFSAFPQREGLASFLKTLGADINTAISSKTDIFIYGSEYGPAKMKKVDEVISKGGHILKMDEKLLYEEIEKL